MSSEGGQREYNTNFHRGLRVKGNALNWGEDLIITVPGLPIYITAELFKRKGLFGLKRNLIQIEQTGTKQNPSNETISLELKRRKAGKMVNMDRGKYAVKIIAHFNGVGEKHWYDKFEVE